MDSNESKSGQNKTDSGKIYIKKSILSVLIISVISVSLVASFFAGSYINIKSDQVTESKLNDAMARLQLEVSKNQAVNEQPKTQPIIVSIDDDAVKGDPNAPITIVEFSDFQCPYCARFHTETFPLILEQYISTGKVKFVYRDFPLDSIHRNAIAAAVASECAHEQDKYWQYHDALFENQQVWNKSESALAILTFKEFATKLNLNQEQFDTCLDSGKYVNEINNDLKDGRDYKITGTPGFFIGNQNIGFAKIDGAKSFEVFKSIIDSQLNT